MFINSVAIIVQFLSRLGLFGRSTWHVYSYLVFYQFCILLDYCLCIAGIPLGQKFVWYLNNYTEFLLNDDLMFVKILVEE